MNPSLLYLHREDVSRALPPVRDLTDTVERAFALHARAGILTAPKGALVTARGDSGIRDDAQATGVSAFITKPFSPVELTQLVTKLLAA